MERTWDMNWFDVVRMADHLEMRMKPSTIEIIKFLPNLKDYKRKGGTVEQLRRGMYYSFLATKKEFWVRRWIIKEIGKLPDIMEQYETGGDRWNIVFKKE